MKIPYYLYVLFFICFSSYGQWDNLNTGINDNLNGVVFFQSNGVVSGENGIYFTTTGGSGSASWTELHDVSNPTSAIFEDTKFTNCNGSKSNLTSSGIVYACGQTQSDSRAVIFKINVPEMTYTLVYTGAINTKLNRIACQNSLANYAAVGDNGKIVSSNGTIVTEITPISSENLTGVVFLNTSSNLINFAGNDKVWRATINGSNLVSISTIQNANLNSKDIEYNTTFFSVGNDKINTYNLGTNPPSVYPLVSNYPATISANTCLSANGIYIGTNDGIYKYVSTSTTPCLEWQPSSGNFVFNRFWAQNSSSFIYTCGNNGIVMRTSNNGGSTKPYVSMTASNFCLGSPTNFTLYRGSGNSVKWYVNNQLISTSLTGLNYTFPTTGLFNVSVEVTNSSNETTTISRSVAINQTPQINQQVTLNDYILCKEETVQVQIDNSEIGVKYVLKKLGVSSFNFGESGAGNGGNIVFTSLPINQTGDYYIEAVDILSNCSKRFTDNISIVVENTHADFTYNIINANIGELVDYHQKCSEAVNYQWEFSNGSDNITSTSPNPQNSYSIAGQVSVTLDASSINNCHDIVTQNGTNVVAAITNVEDCMLLVNHDEELPWPGYYREDISQTSPTTDGFMSCGAYNNIIFDSNHGVTYNLQNKKGGYLSKYDDNGILKWVVYTINLDTSTENDNYITSCVEDLDGNIYISGKSEDKFYDTSGQVTDLNFLEVNTTSYFLIKLNSKGELLWRLQNRYAGFNDLIIDNQNNVIAQIGCSCGFGYSNISLYKNGVFTQFIGNSVSATDTNLGIVKFSPDGIVLWDTEIRNNQTNSTGQFQGMHVDNLNNIYFTLSGFYGALYSVSNSNVTNVSPGGFIIAKYDPFGNLSWVVQSKTTGTTNNSTYSTDFSTDEFGNIYIVGRNDCSPIGGTAHIFQNADGTITQTTKGTYFVAKVNTNGICEWIRSTTQRIYGSAGRTILDNDEIYVLGSFTSGNSNPMSTGIFESTNGNNYSLTMNRSNDFMAVYDLNGNLKRVVMSYEGTNPFAQKLNVSFFKKGNSFYASRNLNNLVAGYSYFGNVFPSFDGYDGTTVKFNESCGTTVFNNQLSVNQFESNQIKLYPNPTNKYFSIEGENLTNSKIIVTDVLGNIILKRLAKSNLIQFDSTNLSSGIYLVTIENEGKVITKKLIVN